MNAMKTISNKMIKKKETSYKRLQSEMNKLYKFIKSALKELTHSELKNNLIRLVCTLKKKKKSFGFWWD